MGRQKLQLSSDGFTLVELLVVTIIIGIIGLSLANFIATWLQEATYSQARSNLLSTAEGAMDKITADIRLSGDADDNNRWPDTYGPSGQYSWASGSKVLVLAKVAEDSSSNIIYTDPAQYITQKDNEVYYLSGTTLYRRTLKSTSPNDAATTTCPAANASSTCPADTIIATGVTSLSFSYYDLNGATATPSSARSVQVAITLSQTSGAKTISANYSTRMVFRNE